MIRAAQRAYTRHPIALRVEVRGAVGWVAAETVDISRTGLQLRMAPGLESAPVVQLRIHLDPVAIVVLARVIRRVGGVLQPGTEPTVGLELMSMPPEHRKRWDEFVLETSKASAQMTRVTSPPRGERRTSTVAPAATRRASAPDAPFLSGTPTSPIGGGAAGARVGTATPPGPAGLDTQSLRRAGPDAGHGGPQPVSAAAAATLPHAAPGLTQPVASYLAAAGAASGYTQPIAPLLQGTPPGPTAQSAIRPALARAPTPTDTVLRVRPASQSRLQALVERRLATCDLFLRPDIDLHDEEKVVLVLVHHATDGELAMPCEVDRVLPGRPGSRPGVMLRFAAAPEADAAAIRAFVVDGVPPSKLPSAAAVAQVDAEIEALRAAAGARPEDARRWIRLGWALLRAGRAADATLPLQRGMTLAPTLAIAPLLLVLAHGLIGDAEGARATLTGIDADELLETLLD